MAQRSVEMTHTEATEIARFLTDAFTRWGHTVKAVHVGPRLHGGHCTIRVHCVPQSAEEPEAYVFTPEDLVRVVGGEEPPGREGGDGRVGK